jgi:hypothetical protein
LPIEAHIVVNFDALCDALAAGVAAQRGTARTRVFGKSAIVVPTQHHARWLELGIAKRNNIASGLEFLTIQDLYQRAALVTGAKVLDTTTIRNFLLGILLDELSLAGALQPVRDYVWAVPGDNKAIVIRAVGLADRLASLYTAYAPLGTGRARYPCSFSMPHRRLRLAGVSSTIRTLGMNCLFLNSSMVIPATH